LSVFDFNIFVYAATPQLWHFVSQKWHHCSGEIVINYEMPWPRYKYYHKKISAGVCVSRYIKWFESHGSKPPFLASCMVVTALVWMAPITLILVFATSVCSLQQVNMD